MNRISGRTVSPTTRFQPQASPQIGSSLQSLADSKKLTSIDFDVLVKNGLASKSDRIKILGRGELTSKMDVKAHAFSATAKAAIESKGGTTSIIGA